MTAGLPPLNITPGLTARTRLPDPTAFNPLVKIFIIGMVAGAFVGTLMALLMEYGGDLDGIGS
jgi:hypothetical protein